MAKKPLSPGTIFVMLRKAKTVYQKQEADPKSEPELRHKKIVEDIKTLRAFAKREGTGADLGPQFEARKKVLLKRMKEHYQKLKKGRDRDENKGTLPKYLKTFGLLTMAVRRLNFNALDDSEDEGASPDVLEDEDLSVLDAEDDAALVGDESAPPAPPVPPPPPGAPPKAPPPPAGTAPPKAPPAPTGAPTAKPVGGKVAYAQLLLAWDAARKKVHGELQKLESAILAEFKDDPEMADAPDQVRKLDDVLGGLDTRLQDTLDEALSTAEEDRAELHAEAVGIIDEYRSYLEGDAFIKEIEGNPFVPVAIRGTLVPTLTLIAKKLEG